MQTASTVTSLNIPNFSPCAIPARRARALLPVASLCQPMAELCMCQDVQKAILQGREVEESPKEEVVAAWGCGSRPVRGAWPACPHREQQKWGFAPCSNTFSPIPAFPAGVPGAGRLETVQNKIKRSPPLDLSFDRCWGSCPSFPSPPFVLVAVTFVIFPVQETPEIMR